MKELLLIAFIEVTTRFGWDTEWWAEWAEQVSIVLQKEEDWR